jgi:hypothetical protein
MDQVLLYTSVILAVVSFFLCLYACARVGKLLNSVKGLDWDTIATLTGDIGTIKKSIQTLNNRINGLNSPKLNDELLHYAIKQQNGVMHQQKNNLGG